MNDLEQQQRAAVVAEARSWLRTPYHHEARVKGVGVDCAHLLIGVFAAPSVGLIKPLDIPHYPHDWHMHQGAERYLGIVLDHAHEIPGPPLPGDVVLYRFGRCFSHGAIVVAWPMIIHAYLNARVTIENAEAARWLNVIGESVAERGKSRPRKFFSYWG